jgi:hypothetical protein
MNTTNPPAMNARASIPTAGLMPVFRSVAAPDAGVALRAAAFLWPEYVRL